MQLTTSLRLCHKHRACAEQYAILKRSLGSNWRDNQPIPLTMLLDMHGTPGWYTISNTLWALRAVPAEQVEARNRIAANCSAVMLDRIPGPKEHTNAIQVLRAFAKGQASRDDVRMAIQKVQEPRKVWDTWLDKDIQFAKGAWDAWDIGATWDTWDTWGTELTKDGIILRSYLDEKTCCNN